MEKRNMRTIVKHKQTKKRKTVSKKKDRTLENWAKPG